MISIAADLGGTRIKLGIVEDGEIKFIKILQAAPERGLRNALSVLNSEIPEILRELRIDTGQIAGIGMTFPGIVDSDRNRILSAPSEKYSDALGIDLAEWGRDNFSLPVVIENDANMALLGEWQYGAGKGCGNLVMVTLGTGIGTSVLINGMPLRGAHYQAGCLGGHFTLDIDGGRCICGNTGCIEMSASASALARMWEKEKSGMESSLAADENPDYRKVFELASEGDMLANKIVERSIRVWGIALVNLIHAYDPEMIVLSGGIMNAGMLLESLKDYTDSHAWTPWGKVRLVKARYPDAAALLGAHFKIKITQHNE